MVQFLGSTIVIETLESMGFDPIFCCECFGDFDFLYENLNMTLSNFVFVLNRLQKYKINLKENNWFFEDKELSLQENFLKRLFMSFLKNQRLDLANHLLEHPYFGIQNLATFVPLDQIVLCGDLELLKKAVQKGGDLFTIDKKTHENLFFLAAKRGDREILEYLFDQGLDMNQETTRSCCFTRRHYSPLTTAFRYGPIESIEFFLDKGATATVTCPKKSLLFKVMINEHASESLLDFLQKKGFDLKVLNDQKENLLFNACKYLKSNILKYLIRLGLDVNATNTLRRETPFLYLEFPCRGDKNIHIEKMISIIHLLKEAGAQINAENCFGETLLFKAVQKKWPQKIIDLLIHLGLSLDHQNINGDTPRILMQKGNPS